jgi:ATP-dependent Clp protease ATP-binding subunit ClpA
MWEPFTEQARQAIVRAQESAMTSGSKEIRSEHIVLGVLGDPADPAAVALADHLSADALRSWLTREDASPVSNEMVFSVDAKGTIEWAFECARELGHNFVGTVHLMLGVFSPRRKPAPAFIEALALNRDAVRKSLLVQSGVPEQGTWTYRIGDAEPVDAGTLPVLLALDSAIQAAGVDVRTFAQGTSVRIEIREPDKAAPTTIECRLESKR